MQASTFAPPLIPWVMLVERSSWASTVSKYMSPTHSAWFSNAFYLPIYLPTQFLLCEIRVSNSLFLISLTAMPKISGATSNNQAVKVAAEVGTQVVLPCEAQGNPSPLVTWSRNGHPIPPVTAGWDKVYRWSKAAFWHLCNCSTIFFSIDNPHNIQSSIFKATIIVQAEYNKLL